MSVESGPISVDDFFESGFREKMAEMYGDAQNALNKFNQAQKQAASDMKNGLGKTLPETEAELKLWNAQLAQATKGTREYFYAQKQISDLQRAEKTIVVEMSSAYENLNQQYIKARNNARELGVMHGTQSAEFKKAAADAKDYNDKLKAIDAGMGSYQRNVGNYTGALRPMAEILRGIGRIVGVNVEGLREYSGAIIGATHLHHMFGESSKVVVAAEGEQVVAGEAVVATNEEVGASWLAAMGPIGWIIAGLTALGIGIAAWIEHSEKAREEQNLQNTSMDGIVHSSKEVCDAYEKQQDKIDELIDKYKFLNGEITEYQQTINGINRGALRELEANTKKTSAALYDNGSMWKRIIEFLPGFGQLMSNYVNGTNDLILVEGEIAATAIKEAQAMQIANKMMEDHIKFTKELNELDKQGIENAEAKKLASEQETQNEYKKQKDILKIKYDAQQAELDLQAKAIKDSPDANSPENSLKLTGIARQKSSNREVYGIEGANIDKEFKRKAIEREEAYNAEIAKLSNNRVAIVVGEYVKEYAAQEREMVKDNASEKEKAERRTLLYEQTQEKIYNIFKQDEQKELELNAKKTSMMKDVYAKQVQMAKDANDKTHLDLDAALKANLITYDQYLEGIKEADDQTADATREAARKNAEEIRKMQEANDALKVAHKTAQDKLHPFLNSQKQAQREANDAKSANDVKENAAINDVQDQEDQFMNGRSTSDLSDQELKKYQAFEEKKKLIHQQYADENAEIDKQLAIKIAEERAKELTQILDSAKESLDEQTKLQQAALQTQTEQLGSEAEVQATLAAAGKKNTLSQTLADQAQAQEAQAALARKAKEQDEAIELSKLLISAMTNYEKEGLSTVQAGEKALADVAFAKALSSAISGTFKKGTHDTGVAGRLDNDGGMLAILHPHEAVISREKNEALPGMAKAWLAGDIGAMGKILLPHLNIKQDVGRDEQVTQMMIDTIVKEMGEVKAAIKAIPMLHKSVNKDGDVVSEITENNITKTIIAKNAPMIKRLREPINRYKKD